MSNSTKPEVKTAISALWTVVVRLEAVLKELPPPRTDDPIEAARAEIMCGAGRECIDVAYNAFEALAEAKVDWTAGDLAAFEAMKSPESGRAAA